MDDETLNSRLYSTNTPKPKGMHPNLGLKDMGLGVGGLGAQWCLLAVSAYRGKSSFKTKVVQNNRDPVWNHTAKIHDMHDGLGLGEIISHRALLFLTAIDQMKD